MLEVGESYIMVGNFKIVSIPVGEAFLVLKHRPANAISIGKYTFLYNQKIIDLDYWPGSTVDIAPDMVFKSIKDVK